MGARVRTLRYVARLLLPQVCFATPSVLLANSKDHFIDDESKIMVSLNCRIAGPESENVFLRNLVYSHAAQSRQLQKEGSQIKLDVSKEIQSFEMNLKEVRDDNARMQHLVDACSKENAELTAALSAAINQIPVSKTKGAAFTIPAFDHAVVAEK